MAAHNSAACSLCVFFLLLSTATLSAAVSASGSPLCTMPSPAPKHQPDGEDALPLLRSLELNVGYFFGGEDLHFTEDESNETSYSYVTRSFSFLPLHAYPTSNKADFHVSATLTLSGGHDRYVVVGSHRWRRHHYVGSHSATFSFEGYYSNGTTSGSTELCMTGTGTYSEENGSTKRLRSVVLHLRVPNPSSITDPFITGSLEGIGFKTISLVAYAEDDTYNYGKRASCPPLPPSSAAAARGALQAIGANFSCAHLKDRLATSYKLQDGRGAHAPGSSPERRLHISEVQCTTDRSMRAYAAFSNSNDTQMWRRLKPCPPFMVKDVW